MGNGAKTLLSIVCLFMAALATPPEVRATMVESYAIGGLQLIPGRTVADVDFGKTFDAKGTNCQRSEVDQLTNQNVIDPAPDDCKMDITIRQKGKADITFRRSGTGDVNVSKFTKVQQPGGNTVISPVEEWAGTYTEVAVGTNKKNFAGAVAGFKANVNRDKDGNILSYGARLSTDAQVTVDDPKKTDRPRAFAQANDPFTLHTEVPDTLRLVYSLGGVDEFGSPLQGLRFLSDDPDAIIHFEFNSTVDGLRLNDVTVPGELFALTIDAKRTIDSANDFLIQFFPWVGLGLSPDDILFVEDFVRASLLPQLDGSFAMAPGQSLVIIGPGAPVDGLTNLVFDHDGSPVSIATSFASAVFGVPESGTLALLGLGLAGLGLSRRRKA